MQNRLFEKVYGNENQYEQIINNFLQNSVQDSSDIEVILEAQHLLHPYDIPEDRWQTPE